MKQPVSLSFYSLPLMLNDWFLYNNNKEMQMKLTEREKYHLRQVLYVWLAFVFLIISFALYIYLDTKGII